MPPISNEAKGKFLERLKGFSPEESEFRKFARDPERTAPQALIKNHLKAGRFLLSYKDEERRAADGRGPSSDEDSSSDEKPSPKAKNTKPPVEERLKLYWDAESLHIIDYLARDEWSRHLSLMTDPEEVCERTPTLDGLTAHMGSWQKIGVAKILESFNSPLRGLILGDETGLGKSLTALVAALEKRNEMLPHCGPVLVIARPGCVDQWYEEIQKRFDK
ncbi:hypothetical protein F53441_14357, partial [Fusarium austroafricanum]